MIQIVKNTIREILPDSLYIRLKEVLFAVKLKQVHYNHQKALRKIRKKKKIRVAFFLIHDSVWKYECVYELMENDEKFEPVIIVCPYTTFGDETMLRCMNAAYISFKQKGYNVIKTLNEETGQWLDVQSIIKADIIFFTNPYSLTKSKYCITNFQNTLTFYVPYGFMITQRPRMQYDELLHNLVFRFYLETKFHLSQAKLFSRNKGVNAKVTGYPGLDELLFPKNNVLIDDVWKIDDKNIKRIIWAPHHTINDEDTPFNYSNFMNYYEIMLDIAKEFEDRIQIAFKPHPILRSKLYKKNEWGKIRTDSYYEKWNNLVNGQLVESDYFSLFQYSDAMIHDCGSFISEYIVTNKPALYQLRNDSILNGFNDMGIKIVNCQYLGRNYEDVVRFIKNIVIDENDPLKTNRELLLKDCFLINKKQSASENIYNDICDILKLRN